MFSPFVCLFVFIDIDECTIGTHNCLSVTVADCTNEVGSFSCACKSGYTGDGANSCTGKK